LEPKELLDSKYNYGVLDLFQQLPWFLKIVVFASSFGVTAYILTWLLKRFTTARVVALILFIAASGWYFLTGGSDGPRSLNVGDTVLHEDEMY